MKYFYVLLIFFPNILLGQLNGPESVDRDPLTDLYYISNKGNGQILHGPAGGPYSILTTAVNSPHGIEVVGDTVYVCDGNAIKSFQLPGGAALNTYTISGASFLNGLTSDRSTMLWFTDFSTGKVHSLDLMTGQDAVVVANTGTTPNGVIYDEPNMRLIIVNWGGNAPILQYDLIGNALTTVVAASGLSNCDGVALGCDGKFYVSSWGAGAIHTFSNDFSSGPTLFVNGLSQPSDIYYNAEADSVVSPNYGSNTVTFDNEPCLGTAIQEFGNNMIRFYPNPGNGIININAYFEGELRVFDLKGRLLESVDVQGDNVDLRNLENGRYILEYSNSELKLVHRTLYLISSN